MQETQEYQDWWNGRFPLIGFKVVSKIERPPREVVERFRDFFLPDISDWVGTLYTLDHGIRPFYSPMNRLLGTAITVKLPPGDNLMFKKAITMADEGDVLVVDARGHMNWCCGGAGMAVVAQHRGIVGFVVDGAYRDVSQIRALDFPLFARGIAPNTGPKRGPGEINVPVCCGGVIVNPGDILVADEDGIVVVPQEYAQKIIDKLVDVPLRVTNEDWQIEKLLESEVPRRAYYDRLMRERGCEFMD